MAWQFPSDIEKEQNISELDNLNLEKYHDNMHIFWDKLEDGFIFDWTFSEIFKKHKEVILEMMKRKIVHLHPINNLDEIALFTSKKEKDKAIKEIREYKK